MIESLVKSNLTFVMSEFLGGPGYAGRFGYASGPNRVPGITLLPVRGLPKDCCSSSHFTLQIP